MIPEFGHLALIIAFLLSICLSVIPMAGSYNGKVVWMVSARSLTAGMFVFVAISIVLLGVSFYQDDFTVAYVANHSNSLLPVQYKISAVWGGHEGSMLLWIFMLTGWTFAVAVFGRQLPLDFQARTLSVLGMVSVGFILFVLATSNPFDRILPLPPVDGGDLNPFLQDPGFIFHPPTLYMGYVGFAVVFAFSIAALLSGRLDSAWARWCRPWGNLAWMFLTLGIALGSWWAYYELGWGGWWFWDPVENASLMPWLVGTAFIHSLAMSEKRGVFKNWTLFLAIFAFCLSLLGTLLVRSGLLTSVHAFASDPSRGVFMACMLFVVILGSLVLFAFRAPSVKSVSGFGFLSRDAFLLLNSLIFVLSALFVLFGTLYPVIYALLGFGSVSLGLPYFNIFFTILMSMVAVATGIGIVLNWKSTEKERITKWIKSPALLALWLGTFIPGIVPGDYSIGAAIAITLGSWVILASVFDVARKSGQAPDRVVGMRRLSKSYYGMIVAHIGFGVCLLGAALNSIYADNRDVRLRLGEPKVVGPYEYEITDLSRVRGPNYIADVAEVIVRDNGKELTIMHPEKRRYFSGGNPMSEVAMEVSPLRDIYVAMGEPLDNTSWSMRVHYEPMVRWVWIGALLMAIGGFTSVLDKRYRARRSREVASKDAVEQKAADAEPSQKLPEQPHNLNPGEV